VPFRTFGAAQGAPREIVLLFDLTRSGRARAGSTGQQRQPRESDCRSALRWQSHSPL